MQIDTRLAEIDDCLYRLATRALIFHDGKVLLVREKGVEWWSFPGGGIDYTEDIPQALSRELTEELGISATDFTTNYQLVYLGIGTVVNGVPRANLFYRVEIPIDRIQVGKDILELGWFAPKDITSDITLRYVSNSNSDIQRFMKTIEMHAAQ